MDLPSSLYPRKTTRTLVQRINLEIFSSEVQSPDLQPRVLPVFNATPGPFEMASSLIAGMDPFSWCLAGLPTLLLASCLV